MHVSQAFPKSCAKTPQPRRGRQQLIVQINIGKKGGVSEIRLSDINNMNYIEYQIKAFIKTHGLKETAFAFIKELIVKQIGLRREQIYQESHSKCSKHCKCESKMSLFQEKEKKVLGVISFNQVKKGETRSLQKLPHREGQHLSIKITQKDGNESRNENSPSFAYNNLYTQPSVADKDRITCFDEVYSSAFEAIDSTVPIEKEQRIETSNFFAVKPKDLQTTMQSSFQKTSQASKVSNVFEFFESKKSMHDSVLSQRKVKILSTKERKQAIMTPKKGRTDSKPILLNEQHLENMVTMYKDNLKQANSKLIHKILSSPLFPDNCISPSFQAVIESLFRKLTLKNPPGIDELHSQYVSYQQLERQELQFMGALFQKIDHKQLNNLNYGNFRSNALKYCWKELQALAERETE